MAYVDVEGHNTRTCNSKSADHKIQSSVEKTNGPERAVCFEAQFRKSGGLATCKKSKQADAEQCQHAWLWHIGLINSDAIDCQCIMIGSTE